MFSALLAVALLWPDPPPVDKVISSKAHSGIYISGFETSLFEPCDSNERWWLETRDSVSDRFAKRVQQLRAEYEKQTGEPLSFSSPALYITAKGDVSELGEHGHMGQYDRRLNLLEFSGFRQAKDVEVERCVTSGFVQLNSHDDQQSSTSAVE